MREPLRHTGFRLLFLAQCASFLGDAIFIVAIAFAALEVTGSAAALGIVLATGSAMLVLTLLFSGVWADRLPRLRIMIASDRDRRDHLRRQRRAAAGDRGQAGCCRAR